VALATTSNIVLADTRQQVDFVPIVVVPEIPVMRDWDLSLQFLVPLIDGSRTVQQIADDGMMDTEIVKNALHHLVYYGYIRITPPLYVCRDVRTPLFHTLQVRTDAVVDRW